MRILVTTASKHAATHEIGQALAEGLRRRGVDAVAAPLGSDPPPADADAVVIGSAVYAGHWMRQYA